LVQNAYVVNYNEYEDLSKYYINGVPSNKKKEQSEGGKNEIKKKEKNNNIK